MNIMMPEGADRPPLDRAELPTKPGLYRDGLAGGVWDRTDEGELRPTAQTWRRGTLPFSKGPWRRLVEFTEDEAEFIAMVLDQWPADSDVRTRLAKRLRGDA